MKTTYKVDRYFNTWRINKTSESGRYVYALPESKFYATREEVEVAAAKLMLAGEDVNTSSLQS